MEPGESRRPVTDILRSLGADLQRLVGMQIELALAEVHQKISMAGHALLALACGLLLALAAFLVVLQAVVQALAASMPAWLAAGLVGLVVAAVAAVWIWAALRALHTQNLMPRRTMDALRRDKQLIKETLT
ncbi:MAG: phage holin family protein [Proteobacteria bacterium]|nr:phage holin family protein [Pseudomonadota bacterium]MDA1070494.1 phage holin family protein [Pseudomonadota bacterium]